MTIAGKEVLFYFDYATERSRTALRFKQKTNAARVRDFFIYSVP